MGHGRGRGKNKKPKFNPAWEKMINEPNVRQRMEGENPEAVRFLDYLAGRVAPYEGYGWTVFCDWLHRCFFGKGNHTEKRPLDVQYFDQETLWQLAFPSCR